MMELVAARTAPLVYGLPKKGIILLSGYPKSGKSWLASSAPESYVMGMEKGTYDRIPHGRIQEISSLVEFNEVMNLVMPDPDIKTVVIDTVDALTLLIKDAISSERGTTNMQPKPGLDSRVLWSEFFTRVRTIVDALRESDKLVILVSHTKPPEKDDQGRVVEPATINVSGQGRDYILSWAEMIGHVGVRVVAGQAQHYVTFRAPSDLAVWRTRVEELADREIVLDKANPWKSLEKAAEPRQATPPVKLVPKPVDKKETKKK